MIAPEPAHAIGHDPGATAAELIDIDGPDATQELAAILVGRGIPGLDVTPAQFVAGEIVWKLIGEHDDDLGMHHAFYRQVLIPAGGLVASLDPSVVRDGLELVGGAVGIHSRGGRIEVAFGAQHRGVDLRLLPAVGGVVEAFELAQDAAAAWPGFAAADWRSWPEPLVTRFRARTRIMLATDGTPGQFGVLWEIPTVDREGEPFALVLDAQASALRAVEHRRIADNCTHATGTAVSAQGIPENPDIPGPRGLNAMPAQHPFGFQYEAQWPQPGTGLPAIKVFLGMYGDLDGYSELVCPGDPIGLYGVMPLPTVGGQPQYSLAMLDDPANPDPPRPIPGDAAGDATYFTKLTMETFRDKFGREGWDGSGDDARICVDQFGPAGTAVWNHPPDNNPDACPDDSVGIFRPDGDNFHASAAIDAVAHEWGHAIGFNIADPPPYGYCDLVGGQLHEGFADVIGHYVELVKQPWWPFGGYPPETSDWGLLEDSWVDGPKRKADVDDNPVMYLFHREEPPGDSRPTCSLRPDGSFMDESHQRGNMLPAAFRLLAVGGTNPVCLGHPTYDGCATVTVPALGLDKAARILYRAWTEYVTSTTDWQALRLHAERAAFDLYSSCPSYSALPEQDAIDLAFASIGYNRTRARYRCL